MIKGAAVLLMIGMTATVCLAEPRWCSVIGTDPSNKLVYPPIARAAQVQGVVLVHMIYVPNGKVERVEPISGLRMLSDSLARQLGNWHVKTDATGDDLCETLVIASFTVVDAGQTPLEEPKKVMEPSILRLHVETSPLVLDTVISDPAPMKR